MTIFKHKISRKKIRGNRKSCQLFVMYILWFLIMRYVNSAGGTFKKNWIVIQ